MPKASSPSIEPLGAWVTIDPLPDDPYSDTIVVVNQQGLTRKGRVAHLGPAIPDLAVGDTVLYRPLQGIEVGDTLLVPASAILATIEP